MDTPKAFLLESQPLSIEPLRPSVSRNAILARRVGQNAENGAPSRTSRCFAGPGVGSLHPEFFGPPWQPPGGGCFEDAQPPPHLDKARTCCETDDREVGDEVHGERFHPDHASDSEAQAFFMFFFLLTLIFTCRIQDTVNAMLPAHPSCWVQLCELAEASSCWVLVLPAALLAAHRPQLKVP